MDGTVNDLLRAPPVLIRSDIFLIVYIGIDGES